MRDEAELISSNRSQVNGSALLKADPTAPIHPMCGGMCQARDLTPCRQIDCEDMDRLFPDGARLQARKTGTILFLQGEPFDQILIVQSGWVSIHKGFENGQRQIIRFALPGDLIGFEGNESGMAYTAETITDMTFRTVKQSTFYQACAESPRLAMSFASMMTREALSAWNHVGALGQQTAQGRVANLLLDLHRRITAQCQAAPCQTEGPAVRLPLRQVHIADATGLTSVHVCRTLKQMRTERLLEFRKGELILLDPDRLAAIAQLDPDIALNCPPAAPPASLRAGSGPWSLR